jgi:DNA-binding protein H-NS
MRKNARRKLILTKPCKLPTAVGNDLNKLSLEKLKQLQKQVAKAIETFEARKKAEVVAKLEEKAKEMGFTLADLGLISSKTTKVRKPAEPKYANPANKAEVWSGRGRQPGWYIAALKRGLQPDDLAIKKAA